jgi:hypothetical protein
VVPSAVVPVSEQETRFEKAKMAYSMKLARKLLARKEIIEVATPLSPEHMEIKTNPENSVYHLRCVSCQRCLSLTHVLCQVAHHALDADAIDFESSPGSSAGSIRVEAFNPATWKIDAIDTATLHKILKSHKVRYSTSRKETRCPIHDNGPVAECQLKHVVNKLSEVQKRITVPPYLKLVSLVAYSFLSFMHLSLSLLAHARTCRQRQVPKACL